MCLTFWKWKAICIPWNLLYFMWCTTIINSGTVREWSSSYSILFIFMIALVYFIFIHLLMTPQLKAIISWQFKEIEQETNSKKQHLDDLRFKRVYTWLSANKLSLKYWKKKLIVILLFSEKNKIKIFSFLMKFNWQIINQERQESYIKYFGKIIVSHLIWNKRFQELALFQNSGLSFLPIFKNHYIHWWIFL